MSDLMFSYFSSANFMRYSVVPRYISEVEAYPSYLKSQLTSQNAENAPPSPIACAGCSGNLKPLATKVFPDIQRRCACSFRQNEAFLESLLCCMF